MGDQQVLERGHALEKPDVLEGPGDPRLAGDLVVGHPLEQKEFAIRRRRMPAARAGDGGDVLVRRDAVTGKGKAPLGRLVEAGDAIEDGRLARAVRADERGDVSPSNRKLKAFTATRPPNRIVRFSTASRGPVSQFISRVPL